MSDEDRRRVIQDVLERCTEIARLSRLYGNAEGAEQAEAMAANAAIELAYLDTLTPANGYYRLPRNDCTCGDCNP